MEDTQAARKAIRLTFTKIISNLNQNLLQQDVLSEDDIKVNLDLLQEKFHQLEEQNKTIFEQMVNSKMSETEIASEIDAVDEYKMSFFRAKSDIAKVINQPGPHQDLIPVYGKGVESRRRAFLLPKIEMKKFNGDIREWLQFWSQFKKIHEDETIEKGDKFQYLIQAVEKDSKAGELVLSYPSTGDNYEKVIGALKMRFGRDELLIEVYVRALLKLILKNASNADDDISLSKLFDKLTFHIHALESLGVTNDKCATILCPLVEASLPDDFVRSWQKHHLPMKQDDADNRLWRLMEFLRLEVEHEERISLGRKHFRESLKKSRKKRKKFVKTNNNNIDDGDVSEGFIAFLKHAARRVFGILIKKI